MAPYPSDPDEIRHILMAHLESTVHWRNNVQTLWNDYGIRLFVEVGPGDILSNLITDTLPDSTCIQTCIPLLRHHLQDRPPALCPGHLKVRTEPRVFPASGRLSIWPQYLMTDLPSPADI
jgi:acyl transferase domain-containing protein